MGDITSPSAIARHRNAAVSKCWSRSTTWNGKGAVSGSAEPTAAGTGLLPCSVEGRGDVEAKMSFQGTPYLGADDGIEDVVDAPVPSTQGAVE
jgi:hypothetical protein